MGTRRGPSTAGSALVSKCAEQPPFRALRHHPSGWNSRPFATPVLPPGEARLLVSAGVFKLSGAPSKAHESLLPVVPDELQHRRQADPGWRREAEVREVPDHLSDQAGGPSRGRCGPAARWRRPRSIVRRGGRPTPWPWVGGWLASERHREHRGAPPRRPRGAGDSPSRRSRPQCSRACTSRRRRSPSRGELRTRRSPSSRR